MCRLQDFNFLLTDFNRALTHTSATSTLSLLQKLNDRKFNYLNLIIIELQTH